jgi:hypothetical protein
MKFRWALANRPESGLPYVYAVSHAGQRKPWRGTYSNEMIHERDSPNSFTFSDPPCIFALLDRMDRNSIGNRLD